MTTIADIKKEIIKKPRKKTIKPPAGAHVIVFPEGTINEHQWHYEGSVLTEIPDKIIGFIYCITNKINNRRYIGKKNFFGTKTRSIKKQQYRERVQSDFITYYGSNDELQKDVIDHGPENFHREIIALCESKGQMSYLEAKYQFHYDVIAYPERYYNRWVMVRANANHMKPHHYQHVLREDLK